MAINYIFVFLVKRHNVIVIFFIDVAVELRKIFYLRRSFSCGVDGLEGKRVIKFFAFKLNFAGSFLET